MAKRPATRSAARTDDAAALRALYAAYGRKDPSVFFGLLAPDVRFRIAAPRAQFRFAGPKRGPAAVQRVIAQIAEDYDWLTFANRELVGDRGHYVAISGGRLKHRKSGAVMTVELIDVIRMRGGKIVAFTEYFDSARVLALQGHDLAPPAAPARTLRAPARKTNRSRRTASRLRA